MCGILGCHGFSPPDDKFQFALSLMSKRGPDAEGKWFGKNTCLGHRRLSIIDLSASAKQPLHNEDKTLHIVVNGEIYNFRKLRSILEKKGHIFRSFSDSEVILHAYEEWGTEEALKKLRGMFAFAIFDEKNDRLIMARGYAGIKPLYYWHKDGKTAFASEIQPLRMILPESPEINEYARDSYFMFGYIPGQLSIYKDCHKLLPGHYAEHSGINFKINAWWTLPLPAEENQGKEHPVEEVREALKEAVGMQLISERPIGVFLSGGTDSALVAMLASGIKSDIRTFTIGFEYAKYDERRFARRVISRLNTNHTELFCGSKDAVELAPRVTEIYGEPFADTSAIPMCLLSRMTREHVVVALSGDGGDELVFGYDVYGYAGKIRALMFLNRFKFLLPILYPFTGVNTKIWKMLRLIESASSLPDACRLGGSIFRDFYFRILRNSQWDAEQSYWNSLFKKIEGIGDIQTAWSWVDLQHYLVEDILAKVDRASMHNSLEVRVPLLDNRIIEKIIALPKNMKIKNNFRKWIFREILKEKFPMDLWARPKHGLTPPMDSWLRKKLNPMLNDYLSAARLRAEGIFNAGYVKRLISEHERGIRDNQFMLWTLLVWEMWRDYSESIKNTPSFTGDILFGRWKESFDKSGNGDICGVDGKKQEKRTLSQQNANLFYLSGRLAKLALSKPLYFAERAADELKEKIVKIPRGPIIGDVNGVKFRFDFSLDKAVRKMYLGIYDRPSLNVLKKYLPENGAFIDVGANIGFISAFAASIVGKGGEVHSFEPVGKYYEFLQELANLNPDYRFFPNNMALGDCKGTARVKVSNVANIGWNTMVEDFMGEISKPEIIETKVIRLDAYIKEKGITRIDLIKIDVEGYEFPVLKGISGFWDENPTQRPPLIVEISPRGNELLGWTLDELEEFMAGYAYRPFNLNGTRQLRLKKLNKTENVLFLAG